MAPKAARRYILSNEPESGASAKTPLDVIVCFESDDPGRDRRH